MLQSGFSKEAFIHRLRVLRKGRNLSQQQMAQLLQLDRSTYTYYENGHSEPSIYTLFQLADFYGVSIDYLVCRTDNPQPYRTDSETPAPPKQTS